MEKIHDPDDNFNYSNLFLTTPTIISGGNYFIKYLMENNPLYIQAPKCMTKQGFLKAGKKMFCDLMFNNENEKFIKWMEDLEIFTQNYIFKNRNIWFENELEMHDIENSFTSPLKLFKGGKYYIVRVNIPTRLGKCSLKIFDEDENDVDYETIKENTNVITILEIQGIKCSAKSFQIEIEIKQMMVLKPNKLFEKCVIHVKNTKNVAIENNVVDEKTPVEINKPDDSVDDDNTVVHSNNMVVIADGITVDSSTADGSIADGMTADGSTALDLTDFSTMEQTKDQFSLNLEEINLNLDDLSENEQINIKNRNDVYYKMYKEAKNKAKIARNMALSAYLEAKRIKNLYMLDDIDDSDDDDEYEENNE
jgi:hypothetical protein